MNVHIRKTSINFDHNLVDCYNIKNMIMSLIATKLNEVEYIIIKNNTFEK